MAGDPGEPRPTRIVQLTDWLPPEFSAVSQYAMLIAAQEAESGHDVTVIGLSSIPRPPETRRHGAGSITIIAVTRPPFDRQSWRKRLQWNARTNLALIRRAWPYMARAETIRFTGSPPFLLHVLVPANAILRRRLLYRITDFYPEVIIAAVRRKNAGLEAFHRLTNRLRLRVDAFEVIGEDMRARLLECGIDPKRIALRRDLAPVAVGPSTKPSARPPGSDGYKLLLYSGNWGVAHDIDTFVEGYRRHHTHGPGRVVLWLNATGSGAEEVDERLRAAGLPFFRQKLVPLAELASLLVTPDAHLITLKSEFMGFVLPSKVYGCVASQLPVVFIGPEGSDVHAVCRAQNRGYVRVDIDDVAGVEHALEQLADDGLMWADGG